MEKTKKANSIRKLLTLMLAFVMVFTGMGIGSWGVDEAWADDTTQSVVQVTTSDLNNKVGRYDGCTLGSADIYFLRVSGTTEKLTFAMQIKNQTVWPYINNNDDYTTELSFVDTLYTMYQNDTNYQIAKKDYESSNVTVSNIQLDNSADHLLVMLYYNDDTFDFLLIEWEKAATVNFEELTSTIAKVPNSGYYETNDLYNGKKESTNGFWIDMQNALVTAKGLFTDETFTSLKAGIRQSQVDKAKEDLEASITNIIPASQLNATYLYETIEAYEKTRTEEFLATATAPSAAAYRKALKEAKDYLASLFDESKISAKNPNGATDENIAANQDKADSYADALIAAARAIVPQEDVTKAKQNLRTIDALAKRYNETENNGRYTDESWTAFVNARSAATEYVKEHPVTENISNAEINQYAVLVKAFQDTIFALTSASDTVKVTFTYTDDFHLRKPELTGSFWKDPDGDQVQKQTLELTSGATLADLWNQIGCKEGTGRIDENGCSTWKTFVNGTLLGRGMYGNALYVLKDGDEIQLVHMEWPTFSFNYIYKDTVSSENMTDILGILRIQENNGKAQNAAAGEVISLTVERTSAHPWSYTGSYQAYEGATLAAYGPQNADGSYPETPILSEQSSGEDGTVSFKLYQTGKYLVTAYDGRENDEEQSLFYSGTVAAPYLELNVTEAADSRAVKAELKAALDTVYKTYPQGYFRPENWTTLKAAYDEASAVLNDAASTVAESYQAQQTAIESIRKIQNDTTAENTRNLQIFRENLNKLPDDVSLITKSVESVVDTLVSTYTGMSDYQKTQLTQTEINKYEKIAAQQGKLPEAKKYQLNLQVKADTAEAEAVLNRMLSYLRENPAKMDRAEGGKYDHASAINIVTPFTFGNYDGRSELFSKTFTEADPLTEVRLYTGTDYAAYFQTRNAGGTFATADGWTISSEDLTLVLTDPGTERTPGAYSTDGHLTVKIGDTAYELKSITYEGLDKEDVISGTQRVYDDSGYKGKNDQTVNVDIADAYLGFAMPYNNVTITLNWAPVVSEAELAAAKNGAAEALQQAYADYAKEKDAYGANWTTLQKAYEDGLAAIEAAADFDAVSAARKAALTAMAKVLKEGAAKPSDDVIGSVYVIIENTTFTKDKWPAGKTYWDGVLVSSRVDITQSSTMMSCVVDALTKAGYAQKGAGSNYISEINGLAEFDGGPSSGWMGTLNDWFTNYGFNDFSVASGKLGDGDEIRIMYTTSGLGEDLGGSWSNSNTTLKDLSVSGGSLMPAFASGTSGNTYEYTLLISGKSANIRLTPTAANKNFLTKIFLNEKVTSNAEGSSFYKRTQSIPVAAGDTIYVGCGERSWPSMNNQEGNVQANGGTWYVLKVVSSDNAKEHIEQAIAELPAADKISYNNYKTVSGKVQDIRSLLNALSKSEQDKVTNLDKLKAAEAKVQFYAEIDEAKAKLNALTSSSSSSQAREALAAYEKLSKEQKEYITIADVARFNELAKKYNLNPISGVEEMPESEVATTGKVGSASTSSPTEVKMTGTTAVATIKAENADEILKQAKENQSSEVVLVVADTDAKGADKVELNLDKAFLQSLLKDTKAKLVVKTPFGQKTYDREAMQALIDSAAGNTIKAEINADNVDKIDDEAAKLEKAKELTASLALTARSAKTAKKNVKVTLKLDKASAASIKELQDMGYTVKYKFYRSMKKASKYAAKINKTSKTYINTSGTKGSKYYYKARVMVYDESGKLVTFSKLTQCKYAVRTWTK